MGANVQTNSGAAERALPHQSIEAADAREAIAIKLFDRLWLTYRDRVPYVRTYEEVVQKAGATFVNDHIAFRTIATQKPGTGIASISRPFEALGYQAAGCYQFLDKSLNSIHYRHANPRFPKLFISELRTWELEEPIRTPLLDVVATHGEPFRDESMLRLAQPDLFDDAEVAAAVEELYTLLTTLPWDPPSAEAVKAVNGATQFGAWVMVHGYAVNHFTALINSHGAGELDSIDKTVAALKQAGVPMKATIEGAVGSPLRQTATEAVMLEVPVSGEGAATMPWTYAYFELAERGEAFDPSTGKVARFEGFFGPQATHLFEMTRVKQ